MYERVVYTVDRSKTGGHKLGVNRIQTHSIDGSNQLFSAGRDGMVRAHTISTMSASRLGCNYGYCHIGWVNDFALTSDKRTMISCSNDMTLKFWRVKTANYHSVDAGQCLGTVKKHIDYVKAMVYCNDTGMLATAGLDRKIIIWDINHITAVNAFDEALCSPRKYRWSLQNMITTLTPQTRKSQELEFLIDPLQHSIYSLGVNEHGTIVSSGSTDGVIRLWDPRSNAPRIGTLKSHTDTVRCMEMKDMYYCISGSSDRTIKYWDLRKQALVQTYTPHADSVWCLRVSGQVIISGGRDKNVFKTSLTDGSSTLICKEKETVLDVSFAMDDQHVWVSTTRSDINCWKIDAATTSQCIPGERAVIAYKILPNSSQILVETNETPSRIACWDIVKGKCIEEYVPGSTSLAQKYIELRSLIYIRPWYSVSIANGHLNIILQSSNCFDGQLYLNELSMDPEDQDVLVTLGEVVLHSLFQQWFKNRKQSFQQGVEIEEEHQEFRSVPKFAYDSSIHISIVEIDGACQIVKYTASCDALTGEEEILPTFVLDCLCNKSTPISNDLRISFFILLFETTPTDQKMLTALHTVRLSSLIGYVIPDYDTSQLNFICNDIVLSTDISLGAIWNFIWRRHSDPILIYYKTSD